MRGKPGVGLPLGFKRRIIPAHAGQTWPRPAPSRRRPDHPRACGANSAMASSAALTCGSSPRMRGKRVEQLSKDDGGRIIPAHAGQTGTRSSGSGPASDHPRACGANLGETGQRLDRTGSSPRMRGKRKAEVLSNALDRIIPAHAGQTARMASSAWLRPDHPRACGANPEHVGVVVAVHGSSPRMRGKRPLGLQGDAHHRIIPAHAGQTLLFISSLFLVSDHPRACGANRYRTLALKYDPGSSPRMRGKPTVCVLPTRTVRIIPAHAGQTCSLRAVRVGLTDHPRACGANRVSVISPMAFRGSSPRMRGKHTVNQRGIKLVRIIPAHAGQTNCTRWGHTRTSDHPRACGANHRRY